MSDLLMYVSIVGTVAAFPMLKVAARSESVVTKVAVAAFVAAVFLVSFMAFGG